MFIENNYYKAVLRYGHVGVKRDVTVARYLAFESKVKVIHVLDLVSKMPGVKANGVLDIKPISYCDYLDGKEREKENIYLQRLKSFNQLKSLDTLKN